MTIGTSLFHALTTRGLSRAGDEIASLQGQISSGKNDPRPSADPVRALRLSAAQEQGEALSRFGTNLERAGARLDQADVVLDEGAAILRRLTDLAIRASSDTVTDNERGSIAAEAVQLRESLIGIANSRDDTGRALFGGYATQGDPFEEGPGGVVYRGDGGSPELQVSESIRMATGLSGQEVFGAAPDETGAGVFGAIDDFIANLGFRGDKPRASVSAADQLALAPALGRAPSDWQMTIEGPAGSARIAFTATAGALPGAVAAINAASAETGVSAALDPQTGTLVLSGAGGITVSDIAVAPAPEGPLMRATGPDGTQSDLVAPGQTRGAMIDMLRGATDHLIDARTRIGAMSASAELQSGVIDARKLMMDEATSQLQDLDLADALTRLKRALTERDAGQQAYVKITQKSLFDYMR
ncbi:flagellar hook-associated protein FlgL [Roseovarius aquimarinus]|uniref:Flagellar hook-associated protein FlgL n=1 Tax=Roseovarius aquimarinus TaxID=1229156 RepID=A0ABW7I586_9RHOB